MKQYLDLLEHILNNGNPKGDRTGTGTLSCFGYQMRFDLSKGFPLVTTKKMFWKGVVHELLWMLKGDTNIKYLQDNGVHIWDQWADENGDLGPVYGKQWRSWQGFKFQSDENYEASGGVYGRADYVPFTVDQIKNVVERIKTKPDCRRLIVSAWNPSDIDEMKLPPCHCFFQFYVNKGTLSCQLYQRSADVFLGVPFNIASYALLTHLIAQVCGLDVGEFIHTFGDVHMYRNHTSQVMEQLTRNTLILPKLVLNPNITNINQYTFEDIQLDNYFYHPPIKGEVSV